MRTKPDFHNKLVLFCGPSGSGKTTIVQHLLKNFPQMKFSVSATTREKRANEINGKDYYFLSPGQFKAKITNNEFLEWEEVYRDRFYGTLKSEVQLILDSGMVAVFDVDVEGGLAIRKEFGSKILDVFVMPPSVEELQRRLVARATESEESLMKRLNKAEKEMHYAFRFNHVIVNSVLKDACKEAETIVRKFLEETIIREDEA